MEQRQQGTARCLNPYKSKGVPLIQAPQDHALVAGESSETNKRVGTPRGDLFRLIVMIRDKWTHLYEPNNNNCPLHQQCSRTSRLQVDGLERSLQNRRYRDTDLLLGCRQEQRQKNVWGATIACLIEASAFRLHGECCIRTSHPTPAY